MQAVKDNKEFTLRWPVESQVENASITRIVSAKEIWDKFVDAAWSSAEPGALFWDNVTKNGTADIYESLGYKSVSTNPCVTGDTIVSTNAGKKTVRELSENKAQFNVLAYDEQKKEVVQKSAVAFKTKDNAKILRLKTKSGKEIRLTPDHRVYTQRGWVEAGELTTGDKILSIE
jgi:ribonucleoside-diphosphate reductase alpha chain